MAKIDAFFKLMFDQGASDLHLASGQQPILRLHGDMERVKYNVLEDGELKAMLYEIAPEMKIKQYEETGDVDFGYEIPGVARFLVEAIRWRDYPIVQNLVMLIAFVVVTVNFLVDMAYMVLDPRIKYAD